MAKKPAKIASQKKGVATSKVCPECGSDMTISKVLRITDASGMFWLCNNSSCATLVATSGMVAGKLQLK